MRTPSLLPFLKDLFVCGILALSGMDASPACVAPPAGLISWWPGEETAADGVSGQGGLLVGSGVTFVPAVVGQGFRFDGTASYVRIPDSPALRLTNEVTLELWYKDTGGAADKGYGLMGKRAVYPSGANYGINLVLSVNSPVLQVFLQDPHYPSYQVCAVPVPSAGVFHHVAGTYRQIAPEQVELKAYVDGHLVKTIAVPGNLARTLNDAPVIIGANNTFEEFFIGIIDEPSIYGRALSAAEVQAIYNAGSAGKCLQVQTSIRSSEVEISWNSVTYLTYQVEFSEDPAGATWIALGSPFIGSGGRMNVVDKVPLGQARRYYRVRPL